MLRDPAASVVREAATALPPRINGRFRRAARGTARRRAGGPGYRLLGTRLRAALLLVGDPEPRLAERASVDLTGFARATVDRCS
ncbi:hypothetical protein [Micromonospora chalcea]|uniref:hypothetical protein n=1 Tax=Micromonospora chalcea TaxID=1874 RepID=UPI0033281D1F